MRALGLEEEETWSLLESEYVLSDVWLMSDLGLISGFLSGIPKGCVPLGTYGVEKTRGLIDGMGTVGLAETNGIMGASKTISVINAM